MNTTSAARQTDGMAIAFLVLSIGSIFLGPLGFIPGIICGHIALARIRRDPLLGGAGLAQAGLIVGYLVAVATTVMMVLFFRFVASGSYQARP